MTQHPLIDLHVHTHFSDGRHSPERVLTLAHDRGIGTIAVADHSTVAGLPEAESVAQRLSMRLIPAVELYSQYKGTELHVLGYAMNPTDPGLASFLADLQQQHRGWLQQVLQRAVEQGFVVDAPRFLQTNSTFMGFDEMVRLLKEHPENATKMNHDLSTDHPDLFDVINTYFRDGGAPPMPEKQVPTEEVLQRIHDAHGVAVLAHPGQTLTFKDDEVIERLITHAALDGIEAVTPHHTWHQVTHYLELAQRLRVFTTAGSDFHGTIGKPSDLIHTRWDYFLPRQTHLPWE